MLVITNRSGWLLELLTELIKVAPAASKKEVKSWRLCKLKKKNSNSEKGKLKVKPFHAYKRTKAG